MAKKAQQRLIPVFGLRLDAPSRKRAEMPTEHSEFLETMFPAQKSADRSNDDKLREDGLNQPPEQKANPHIRRGSPGQI